MEYTFRYLVSLLGIFCLTVPISAFTASYCSSQNTGTTDKFFWTWQSNGKCTDHCNSLGTFAYAVIQYTDCWCSNYAPAQQVSTDDCMNGCPGFGDNENCGNADKGLYVYIEMAGTPSGTRGSSQPSSTSASSSNPNNNNNDQSMTYSVTTESGVVITKTIVVGSTAGPSRTDNQSSGSNKGAIIGGVVGGILFLLAIIGAVIFVLWRRRKQRRQLEDGTVSSSGGITRNVSTLSKSGLLGTTTEKDSQYPPQLQTNFSTHGSRHDTESISPVTASDRRYSQPVMIDSRLDPRAVLTFHGANVSRDSLASIDDSRDYGRQLNVRNPDP